MQKFSLLCLIVCLNVCASEKPSLPQSNVVPLCRSLSGAARELFSSDDDPEIRDALRHLGTQEQRARVAERISPVVLFLSRSNNGNNSMDKDV